MYCKYCGKEINDHEEICGECMSKSNAYKATASEISSVNQEQQYNSSNQGQIIINHNTITQMLSLKLQQVYLEYF